MPKTVLITGASSGFGREAAKMFHKEGWNLAATMRRPDAETELHQLENVEVMKLDVTDPATIQSAVVSTLNRFHGLHALINNAGFGGHGIFEEFTDEDIRAMFDTNFFGALNVSRAVLPIFRAQGEGAIVNITSLAGILSGPTSGVYAATKHALEAITESMAMEYEPLGIKVRSVAPGAFGTGFTSAYHDGSAEVDDSLKPHAVQMRAFIQAVIKDMYANAGETSAVAAKIFDCVTEDMPIRNMVGDDAEAVAVALSSMPRQAFLDQMKARWKV